MGEKGPEQDTKSMLYISSRISFSDYIASFSNCCWYCILKRLVFIKELLKQTSQELWNKQKEHQSSLWGGSPHVGEEWQHPCCPYFNHIDDMPKFKNHVATGAAEGKHDGNPSDVPRIHGQNTYLEAFHSYEGLRGALSKAHMVIC